LHNQKTPSIKKGILYVVATPIGNLKDITLRAVDILRSVDLIAAEDTRHSAHLLKHYAITTKCLAYHEHNEQSAATKLLQRLEEGESIALISDAGTPGISDPGTILVSKARAAGYRVEPIPGPNAAIAALSAAGAAIPHFLFYGFLPPKGEARRRALGTLSTLPYWLVFYESPHRIKPCLADLATVLGGQRPIAIARELTKTFEDFHTTSLDEAIIWIEADSHRQKGEFVLLVAGKEETPDTGESESTRRLLGILCQELPTKQAARLAAEITGEKKNALYQIALQLKSTGPC